MSAQDRMDMYAAGLEGVHNWQDIAQFNSCFAKWLHEVDTLCERFLNISLLHIIETGELYPDDSFYDQKLTPEKFFSDCIVPFMHSENGEEFIDDLIGDLGMWGLIDHRNRADR